MFFSVNVLFCFVFCLCITQNCDDGNSDFYNQRISRMNSNRSADENVVPDFQTKPNRRKKSPETESSARGTNSVEQAANSGAKGTKPEKKKVEVKDELSKLLDSKKLDISELDYIFADFKITLDPFVQKIARTWPKQGNPLRKLLPRWNKLVRMRSSVNMCTP